MSAPTTRFDSQLFRTSRTHGHGCIWYTKHGRWLGFEDQFQPVYVRATTSSSDRQDSHCSHRRDRSLDGNHHRSLSAKPRDILVDAGLCICLVQTSTFFQRWPMVSCVSKWGICQRLLHPEYRSPEHRNERMGRSDRDRHYHSLAVLRTGNCI